MQLIVAATGGLFGVVTLFAGGRVLLGSDPGYMVFQPLLIFNTIMGVAYLVSGLTIWRSLAVGRYTAGAIFFLNLLMLLVIVLIYQGGGAVAVESVGAMTFRTVVWLVLFLGAFAICRSAQLRPQT